MPTVPLALNGYDAQPTTVVPLLSHRRDSQRAHAPPPPIKQVRRTMVNIQSHRHDLPPSCQTGAMPDTNAHTQPPLPSNSAMLSPRPWIPQAAVASPSHTLSTSLALAHTNLTSLALVAHRRPRIPSPSHALATSQAVALPLHTRSRSTNARTALPPSHRMGTMPNRRPWSSPHPPWSIHQTGAMSIDSPPFHQTGTTPNRKPWSSPHPP
jgi:hypothetical protein